MNVVQKILKQNSGFISVSPKHVLTHDNTFAVLQKYKVIVGEGTSVHNASTPVFAMDHDIQNPKSAEKYKIISSFAAKQGIDYYPPGTGIGHQIMIEQGYAFPNQLVMASDSHANMYGGIGALGTPIVRTDAAAIWATGQTWWQIPPVTRVILKNKLPIGSTGKDVIVTLCALFNKDEVLNQAIEFHGDGVQSLSIDDRLTIANMTTEWGALAGLFPVDEMLIEWLRDRADELSKTNRHPRINHEAIDELEGNVLKPDEGAQYTATIELDLSTVHPYVSGPNDVKKAQPVLELQNQNIPINKAYLISCTNSRFSDIQAAAEILKGKKVDSNVGFYVAPASKLIQKQAEESGDWKILLDAGAKVLPAGCGPCIGLGQGLLKDGEVGISTSNRNFKGRMGSPKAFAYLASPAVVAASAVAGKIASPLSLDKPLSIVPLSYSITQHQNKPKPSSKNSSQMTNIKKIEGFVDSFQGQVLFCDADNLNTDGIYPGKYTYADNMSLEDMGKVTMENYDPKFVGQVTPNSILVSGNNFGTGSSREQAATSLRSAGVRVVLAASFSETFKRNAINNGLLVLECPSLIQFFRDTFKEKVLTRSVGKADVNLSEGTIKVIDQTFELPAVGTIAQELVVEGGLERWVKNRIRKNE